MSTINVRVNHQIDRVEIYKDEFHGKSRPWCADVFWKNGEVSKAFAYAYRSRKRLVAMVKEAGVYDDKIKFV
jgi:hypothetical protein